MRENKFSAQKTILDGIDFDSKAEANRYAQLKLLERAKDIRALGCQPAFPLRINGVLIGHYTADFIYYQGGRKIAEDVKGVVTEAASLRMRVFAACFPDVELWIVNGKGAAKRFKPRTITERRAAA